MQGLHLLPTNTHIDLAPNALTLAHEFNLQFPLTFTFFPSCGYPTYTETEFIPLKSENVFSMRYEELT